MYVKKQNRRNKMSELDDVVSKAVNKELAGFFKRLSSDLLKVNESPMEPIEEKIKQKKGKRKASSIKSHIDAFQIGQEVRYKRGKGLFEAKVIAIAGDVVTLERTVDGKQETRLASKIVA
jgi:hypothetical protein